MNKNKNNLVEHWLAIATYGGESVTHALKDLNEAVGSKHTLSRLGEWRNGKRAVPEPVQRYMLRRALPHILRAHGATMESLDDALIHSLAEALVPPNRLSQCETRKP